MSWPLLGALCGGRPVRARRSPCRMARARRGDSRACSSRRRSCSYGLRRLGRRGDEPDVHIVMPDRLLVTLAQFFSFASLEITRFVATDNAKRLMLLGGIPGSRRSPRVVLVAGFVQPVWMLVSAFRRLRVDAPARRVPGTPTGARCAARRVHRRAGLRELLVREGRAAGACVLRGGADCVHFRRVVLGAHRLAAAGGVSRPWCLPPTSRSMRGWRGFRVLSSRCTPIARWSRPRFDRSSRRSSDTGGPYAIDAGPRAISDPSRPHGCTDLRIVETHRAHRNRRRSGLDGDSDERQPAGRV